MVVKFKNHYTPKELETYSNLTFMPWVCVYCLLGVVIAIFWVVCEKQAEWPDSWVNGAIAVVLVLCGIGYYLTLTLIHIGEEHRKTCKAVYMIVQTYRMNESAISLDTATGLVKLWGFDKEYARKIAVGDYDCLMKTPYMARIE